MDSRRYNVGDEVWFAHYDMVRVEKPCPVCFGEKEVTLILGNGDRVVLPCDYCGHGLDEPTGRITEHEYVASAEPVRITKIQSETDLVSEARKYYFGGRYAAIEDLFDTKEEALARCAEKVAQRELEESTQACRLKASRLKSYSWNAGYHLRQAQECRKRAEYHEQKAVLCRGKAKASCPKRQEGST